MNAVLSAFYWLAISIWIAALLAPAAAGIAVFNVLPGMDATFPEFSAATAPNQAAIAGGHVVNPLFIASDIVQLICAAIVLFALGLEQFFWRPAHPSKADYIRIPTLLIAALLTLVEICALGPTSRHHLYAYWDAVKQGSMDVAMEAKAAFDVLHPWSTTLYATSFGLLLIAVVASAVAYSPSHSALLGTGHKS